MNIVPPAKAGAYPSFSQGRSSDDMGWAPAFAGATGGGVKGGWGYIMSKAPFGTLYIGVTADLAARVHQHRNGVGFDFCLFEDINA